MSGAHGHGSAQGGLLVASLGTLGVVYGDIGTSPLYALRESLHHYVRHDPRTHAVLPFEAFDVLGVLSLVLWSLILVVTVKYVVYVLRADNQGEGGILALLALALDPARPAHEQRFVYAIGIFGAALLYGDGMITPAISVLSAVEGVRVEAPALREYVVHITVVILIGVFLVQRFGTAKVGLAFGPIMLLWFATLAALGALQIMQNPTVLGALSPHYAVHFFAEHGVVGLLVLGSVFLVVTGGEALYADMGHFGVRPIRLAWLGLVLPALLLHYFGQGALLLREPAAVENPLLHMAPTEARIPLIILSTLAAVIASQALISGTFSITRQAILLGFAPRLRIEHTSGQQIGQVYLPGINLALMLSTIALVVGFQSSARLAAAYGIAVTLTMVITTLLAHVVARRRWKWPAALALAVTAPLLAMDLAFFGANALKLLDGGWVPIAIAVVVFVLFTTWRKGRAILADRIRERAVKYEELEAWIAEAAPVTVPGTAVYLTAHPDVVPLSLVDNVRHNGALHERVILLSVVITQSARVPISERIRVQPVGERVVRLFGHYGFMEKPDVPRLLELALLEGIEVDPQAVSFVLGRETLIATDRPGMAQWRESLFALMSRNAQRAANFFSIPSERVLEVGAQIEL